MTDTIGHAASPAKEPVEPAFVEQSVPEQLAVRVSEKGLGVAFVVDRRSVVSIPGPKSLSQLEKNSAAADLTLASDEIPHLTAVADRFRPCRHCGDHACRAAMPTRWRIRQLVGDGEIAAEWQVRS